MYPGTSCHGGGGVNLLLTGAPTGSNGKTPIPGAALRRQKHISSGTGTKIKYPYPGRNSIQFNPGGNGKIVQRTYHSGRQRGVAIGRAIKVKAIIEVSGCPCTP